MDIAQNPLSFASADVEPRLRSLFSNLHYTWDKDLYGFVDGLDQHNWRKTSSPVTIIHSYISRGDFDQSKLRSTLSLGEMRLAEYKTTVTWFDEMSQFDRKLFGFIQKPILYFCAEYGLVDWLQIYSGGLGILAGDFAKQMSDHGVPFVGIGIFYHQGYFHQNIDTFGMQVEEYIPQDPSACMLNLVRDESGIQIEIPVWIRDHEVYVRAWELKVGRNIIYLLDTNFEKNEVWEDRMITAHLYGGTTDTRIRQEIVLGIGGFRFAQKINLKPSVIHLNEGHASFLILEKLKQTAPNIALKERLEIARQNILFTNHTLNAAGNDKFDFEIVREYLSKYAEDLGVSVESVFDLGNDQLYSKNLFSMTILGFRGSKVSNAVSKLHGVAARKLWPDYHMKSITNGVHMPTWVCKPISELLEKYVDLEWHKPTSSVDWKLIEQIPDDLVWSVHVFEKQQMINRINSVLGTSLDPNALTIVWTRRFAAYKRPVLFLNNLDRLEQILNNSERPVQFLIGGKAHPQDVEGKAFLQKAIQVINDSRFRGKIVFLAGYNWNLARYLVSGADVWLNNPVRFEEASGTSGMKSGANGVVQFTTLDGWTDEVSWTDKGFVLPQENIHSEIYRILESDIVPTYFDNKSKWINMMKKTMQVCLSKYSTSRMVQDYVEIYKMLSSA